MPPHKIDALFFARLYAACFEEKSDMMWSKTSVFLLDGPGTKKSYRNVDFGLDRYVE